MNHRVWTWAGNKKNCCVPNATWMQCSWVTTIKKISNFSSCSSFFLSDAVLMLVADGWIASLPTNAQWCPVMHSDAQWCTVMNIEALWGPVRLKVNFSQNYPKPVHKDLKFAQGIIFSWTSWTLKSFWHLCLRSWHMIHVRAPTAYMRKPTSVSF